MSSSGLWRPETRSRHRAAATVHEPASGSCNRRCHPTSRSAWPPLLVAHHGRLRTVELPFSSNRASNGRQSVWCSVYLMLPHSPHKRQRQTQIPHYSTMSQSDIIQAILSRRSAPQWKHRGQNAPGRLSQTGLKKASGSGMMSRPVDNGPPSSSKDFAVAQPTTRQAPFPYTNAHVTGDTW